MSEPVTIRYFGWSALSIETAGRALFFDPFFRPYCGAHWYELDDFRHATVVCVTHGHEEHFLDVPRVLESSRALAVGVPAVCNFLRRRNRIDPARLRPVAMDERIDVDGFRITAFPWKHRDINLVKALSKAVFQGNATQLSWAWSSATNAPFYSPYTGFHVELADGLTVLNYNEGFNSKMTDAEIAALGKRCRTDVLLAGMQLDFVADLARGVRALAPRVVVLYPPHEHFHAMMGVASRPWDEFAQAAREAAPQATVVVARPGARIDARSGAATFDEPRRAAA